MNSENGPVAVQVSSPGDPQSILGRGAALRSQLLGLLTELLGRAQAFQLPTPDTELLRAQERLADELYLLLIVGEAKRGKSSFVNALIGQDLLPTDLGEATCQVFYVRPAAQEGFRLRFEDNSVREISRDDLPRYGSQIVQDRIATQDRRGASAEKASEPPQAVGLNQIIRYIEVDVTIRFLPPGMGLMDTPGLGALYPDHAEITYRFIPQADAVVFVLDSEKPINPGEIKALNDIVKVTGDILFVQTKIDRFTQQVWEQVLQRSEQLLREQFGQRLADTRVWPIASPLLRRAATAGANASMLLTHSRHAELSSALRTFLLRVQGWRRAKVAYELVERFYQNSRHVLFNRAASLAEPSESKRQDRRVMATQNRTRYEDAWGPQGERRRILLDELDRRLQSYRDEMEEFFSPHGELRRESLSDVDAATTMDDFRRTVERLPQEIAASAARRWREICGNISEDYLRLQEPFRLASEDLVRGPELLDVAPIGLPAAPRAPLPPSSAELTRRGMKSGLLWAQVTMAVLTATGVGAPVAVAVGLAVGAWRWFRGARHDPNEGLAEAKQQVYEYVPQVLSELQRHYLGRGQGGAVDGYFDEVRASMTDQMESVAARRLAEAQSEIDRDLEQERLDAQQRQVEAEQARHILSQWDDYRARMTAVAAELDALDRALATPA